MEVAVYLSILLLAIGIVFCVWFVVMMLWNDLVPKVFHGPKLGLISAGELSTLCWLVFSNKQQQKMIS